jgi:hypothetical protein
VKQLLVILGTLVIGACATTIQSRTDHDPAQDFSKYRTYAWVADDPLVAPPGSDVQVSALNRRRIIESIESQLSAKGFQKVSDRDGASFTLAYTVGARERIDLASYPDPYRHPWPWGHPYFGETVDVDAYTEGTLAIDIFDGASHQPVWHGRASKHITEDDVRHAAELIPQAVASVLTDFPPP